MANQSPYEGPRPASPFPTDSYVLFHPVGWEEGEESQYGWIRGYSPDLNSYQLEYDDDGGLTEWVPAEDIVEVVQEADSGPS